VRVDGDDIHNPSDDLPDGPGGPHGSGIDARAGSGAEVRSDRQPEQRGGKVEPGAQGDRRVRAATPPGSTPRWLGGPWPWIGLYLAVRIAILATNFDRVSVPTYEIPTGNQAVLLLEGWRGAPWWHFYDNAGGQLLAGLITVPFFALFGTSYAAMKLGSLALGVLLLLAVHRLLSRTVGRPAAALACAGLALAPPVLTGFTLMAMGNHFDGLLFITASLMLSLQAIGHRAEGRALAVSGAAFGLATFLYMGSLLSLALLVPLLARGLLRLGGPARAARGLAMFASGTAVGLIPLVMADWITEGRSSSMATSLVMRPVEGDAAGLIEKGHVLLTSLLPRSACFEEIGPVPGHCIGWFYVALAASAWAVVARHLVRLRSRRDPHAQRVVALLGVQLLYPLAFLCVVWLTHRTRVVDGLQLSILESRYFVSFYFYSTLLIASAVALAWRSGGAGLRRLARAQAVGLGLACLASLCLVRTDPEGLTDVLRSPATDFRYYSGLFGRDGGQDPETGAITLDHVALARHCAAFEGEGERFDDVLFGLGWYLGLWDEQEQLRLGAPRPTALLLEPYPEEWHAWIARGLGGKMRERIRGRRTGPAVRAQVLQRLSGARAHEVLQGLGMSRNCPAREHRSRIWPRAQQLDLRVRELLPELDRTAIWVGVGADARRRLSRGLVGDEAWLAEAAASLPPPKRAAFEAGLTKGLD